MLNIVSIYTDIIACHYDNLLSGVCFCTGQSFCQSNITQGCVCLGGSPIHYLYGVCAAQRGRDFEAPDLEPGIHFRGVF